MATASMNRQSMVIVTANRIQDDERSIRPHLLCVGTESGAPSDGPILRANLQ
jgi:hypothetical protein